ncbi:MULTISPECIES: hypothetical protein [Lysobacter]|jgi:hypothetical protein|uniref:Secreted protein n=1 Tax=Lysobacter gummosus TaxID=262324 RepID=A0ABY3XJ02_9GAMM|nr:MULTISPECIES: hypothetical protein [Lysobacter]ALN91228.1 putative secreted protein [Lysobacter gummosus]UJB21694.1 hypothetical protein L1A79_11845 [Lysobacter capsici]UJQ29189.1 hypothetical protein L2D09_03020 [Lysobacter gummosus]UNP31634.1 hypothetical protein MOV92_10460 [Lysobacter gummosus]
MNRNSRIFGSCLGLLLVAVPPAHAQKDRQVYEDAIARSAEVCPDHSAERTRAGVMAVPAATLKVLEEFDVALCPDRRLDSTTPVVWYGVQNVFAWNPSVKGAPKVMATQAAAYARSEEFPQTTVVWKANGKLAEGALVPSFRKR